MAVVDKVNITMMSLQDHFVRCLDLCASSALHSRHILYRDWNLLIPLKLHPSSHGDWGPISLIYCMPEIVYIYIYIYTRV